MLHPLEDLEVWAFSYGRGTPVHRYTPHFAFAPLSSPLKLHPFEGENESTKTHVLLCSQPHVSFHACRATPVSHKSLRQRGTSRLWGLFRRAVPAYFACARSGDTTLCSMTGVTTGMILHGVVSPDPRLLTRMLALPQSGFLIVLAMQPGLRIHLKSLRTRREIVNWVQIAQTPRPPRPHDSSASVKLTGRFRTGHLYLALRCCGCGPGESDANFSCPAHTSL